MKKLILPIFVIILSLTSCGPAGEDRVQMDRIAKRMSDSLLNLVDSSLKDPLKYVNLNAQPVVQPPAATAAQPTTAPTATK
jgi:hypothetical protein